MESSDPAATRAERGAAEDISDQSIAIAHEHYPDRGGGEVVAEHLSRTFGNAPIYTGFAEDHATPEDGEMDIHDLFGHGLTGAVIRRSVFARDAYYQYAWEHVPDLWDYDVVIQSGNNPGWYVPRDHQAIVKYVHSPPRTPFDRFDETPPLGLETLKNPVRAAGVLMKRFYTRKARKDYEHTLNYPDLFIANSDLVARRMRLYWNVPPGDIRVVYPPVDTESYYHSGDDGYYFTFSRLTDAKNFDEIIRAFNDLGHHLIIAGSGPKEDELKELAGDTVEFRGFVSESEKRDLLANARGFVYAATNEDFGIVPVEALASGCPVIGVRDGFTEYQISDGETGILYDRGPDNLTNAIRRFEREGVAFPAEDIMDVAGNYNVERFQSEIRDAVATAISRATINPETESYTDQTRNARTPEETENA